MSEINSLPINADRICEAISKIGYNPSSAILDIVDNSFMADATNIIIQLFIKEGMTLNKSQNVEKIQIIDDGNGMNENGIKTALQLGSDVEYSNNSLSKYGLGLKSAGFSLGRKIEVISKYGDNISERYFLDRDVIKSTGIFGYLIDAPNDEQIEFLQNVQSGTVISISNLSYTSKVSAARISDTISKKGGVLYCEYLKKENVTFKIQIIRHSSGGFIVEKEKSIFPKDILFWDEAYANFDKENYDGRKPCQVLDDSFENPLNPSGSKIKIKATIFPMDKMKNFAGFTDDERKRIAEYEIGQTNSGFFFYRNGRLIKWGENLFDNRLFGFRAIISFNSEHDELFDVDVSKQHLTVSEEIFDLLVTITRIPRAQSKEAFEICNQILKTAAKKGNEGAEFNVNNSTLEEEEDESDNIDATVLNKRKEFLDITSENLAPELPKYENEEEQESFRRIRYWEKGRNLWVAGSDRLEGTYVLIDKLHSFYDLVLNDLDPDSPYRQAIEALLHSLAVGQIQTIKKFTTVDEKVLIDLFDKFIRSSSHQLDNWVGNNRDLFENEGE
jgi:hypothetical protein